MVVHQLKDGKVPRPGCFSSNFFHKFWELIKIEMSQVVEELRTLRWMLPRMDATFIALIPKGNPTKHPSQVSSYCPVQLNLQDYLQNHCLGAQISPPSHNFT